MSTTIRSRLEKDLLTVVERVNRLSDALDRLRQGAYGVCIECGGRLSPARLRAAPEVETCVGCQSGLERLDRQIVRSRHMDQGPIGGLIAVD